MYSIVSKFSGIMSAHDPKKLFSYQLPGAHQMLMAPILT